MNKCLEVKQKIPQSRLVVVSYFQEDIVELKDCGNLEIKMEFEENGKTKFTQSFPQLAMSFNCIAFFKCDCGNLK